MEDSAAMRWGPAMATTAAKADTGTISTTHRLTAPPHSSALRLAETRSRPERARRAGRGQRRLGGLLRGLTATPRSGWWL